MLIKFKQIISLPVILFFLSSCSSLSPLNDAVSNSKFNEIKSLIDNGADINQIDLDTGRTPLIFAAYYRNNTILRYLLEKGANVNTIDKQGRTALLYASYYGDINNVKDLLDFKADFNIRDKDGYTSLNYANNFEYTEIAKILKDKGAK